MFIMIFCIIITGLIFGISIGICAEDVIAGFLGFVLGGFVGLLIGAIAVLGTATAASNNMKQIDSQFYDAIPVVGGQYVIENTAYYVDKVTGNICQVKIKEDNIRLNTNFDKPQIEKITKEIASDAVQWWLGDDGRTEEYILWMSPMTQED